MKILLCLALAVVSCNAGLPVPYDVYVRNGGLPLPEALRTGKWYNPERNSSAFIVGGSAAASGDVPWIVSLATTSHFCGGSILDKRNILTAAHCIDGQTASRLNIRIGSLQHASGGTQLKVTKINKHPGYSSSTIDNDVAVLNLASDIAIDGSKVKATSIPTAELATGTQVLVAGWGTTSQGGSLPANLMQVNVPIVDRTKCRGAYGTSAITNNMICAGIDAGGKDSCQGDSGGPLTSGGVQYGVVSWGRGCAQANYPGVYANTVTLGAWIKQNMA